MGELLPSHSSIFKCFPPNLPVKYPGGTDCRYAHSISNENDDVFGYICVILKIKALFKFILSHGKPVFFIESVVCLDMEK